MNVIGLMSGSSLDGIDLVDVDFWNDGRWHFEIVAKDNFEYDAAWQKRLSDAFYMSPDELQSLDIQYGTLLGNVTAAFIKKNNLKPEIVASHGHTIFHRPQEHYTLQIGDGQALANACGITVINDFRIEDVTKGGQGAPLVPIGDKLLFSEYPICLNIGGIANVSYDVDGQRIAYDICIANQALNYLAGIVKNKDIEKRRDETCENETRGDETRRDETCENETRGDETRRDETCRDETRRDETRKNETRGDEMRRDETCGGTSLQFDKDGLIARSGIIDYQLLEKLNDNQYYSQKYPKSLGREFFEKNIKPLFAEIENTNGKTELKYGKTELKYGKTELKYGKTELKYGKTEHAPSLLRTFVEHIAMQIGKNIDNQPIGKMLVTGGGAKNKFLIERIQAHTKHEVVIPNDDIIDYKEALVFAFLGLLRKRNEINVLRSVTGASSDSCAGKVFEVI